MLSENINTKAMLVHHHTHTGMVSVTSHDVLALDDGRGFTLGAGRAFSAYDKAELASLLLNEGAANDFLPEHFLVHSRTVLCWYRQPEKRLVPFRCGSIEAPLPGLIFVAMGDRPLRCFAFKGKLRPTPETPLYYAPLGNVYAGGTFCTGNNNVPREVRRENIPAWEAFVLDSTNTHSGSARPVRGCGSFEALIEFYQQLAQSQAKTFPANKLVPYCPNASHLTLGDVLNRGDL